VFDIDQVVCFDHPRPEMALLGWACFDDLTPADEVWLDVAGVRTPCLMQVPRPDVARYHNAPALSHAGFLGRFAVTHASMRVRLIAVREGADHLLGTYQAEWRGRPLHDDSEQRDYTWWLRHHEPRLFWPVGEIQGRLRGLNRRPLISIVLPTYNTQLYHLQRCLDSVTSQHYPHWELCISDDGSSSGPLREYLEARAAREPRIRLSFSPRRGGISAASNRSIAVARGDFLVLLDHDDELHPHALLEVVRCLNAHPETDLIYSDEDKIDQAGVRAYPSFKPDFDPDFLRAFHYIGHLVAIRTSLVRQVGGFDSAMDGAQDWDLVLRVTSATAESRIRHIAKPLYHWRMHEESTAMSLDAKPYATRAWQRVLERHVGTEASVRVTEGMFRGSMRVVRPVPPDIRVAIVYRARDGSHQRRALARTKLPRDARFFELVWSAIRRDVSQGQALETVRDLQSDIIIVVNCAVDSVNHLFVEELTGQAARADCGIVGPTILGSDGKVVTAGLAQISDGTMLNPFEGLGAHELGYMGQARVVRQVSALASHAFAFRTSLLEVSGGLAILGEDSMDRLCTALILAARARGFKVLHTPHAVATLRREAHAYSVRQKTVDGEHRPTVNYNLQDFPSVETILKDGVL
jgi:O-antigen biosynthesis protein